MVDQQLPYEYQEPRNVGKDRNTYMLLRQRLAIACIVVLGAGGVCLGQDGEKMESATEAAGSLLRPAPRFYSALYTR